MNDLISKLYKQNEAMEESQLRSVLLFSEFGKTHARTDMLPKAVLSIIIHEKGQSTLESVVKCFGPCYHHEASRTEIEEAIRKLEDKHLIQFVEGKYIAITESDTQKTNDFFANLDERTERLINSIIAKYEFIRGKKDPNHSFLRKNITRALSLYLKLSGLNAVMSESEEGYQPVNNAVNLIIEKMDRVQAANLIDAIGQVVSNPSKEDLETLNIWAKAYVLTQVMKIDPTLADFKATKLRGKTFVLDTDIVLNLLASHARYSQQYRTMLNTLTDLGCKIIIPDEVVKDVEGHVRQAIDIYNQYGLDQIDNFPNVLLGGPKSNVFIEDYVKLRRQEPSKKLMAFPTYLGNIYNFKDISVFKKRLKPFIKNNVDNTLDVVDISEDEYAALMGNIMAKASDSIRGGERSYNKNKELSRDDARLFITLKSKNKELEHEHGHGMLKYKYYFLTQSKRTVKAAQELGQYDYDIICHPQALGSVLADVGMVDENELSIINLFENPFLAFTGTALWENIKPVLDAGVQVSFMEIQQLEYNAVQVIDDMLLCQDPDERIRLSKKYRDEGYSFWGQLADMSDAYEKVKQEVIAVKGANERLEQSNAKKDQEIQYWRNVTKQASKKPKNNTKEILKRLKK